MLEKQVKWLFFAMLISILLFIAASLSSCTEEPNRCTFDEISQCNWETSPGQHGGNYIKVEDGVFTHRKTTFDESEQIDFRFTKMLLHRGRNNNDSLYLLDDIYYIYVGDQIRFDCNQIYIRDFNGFINCLDIFK